MSPLGWAMDADGNLYVADGNVGRVRRIDAVSGTIDTIAGSGYRWYDWQIGGMDPLQADLDYPSSVAVAPDGWIYVLDWDLPGIWGIDPETGLTAWVAGDGYGGAASSVPAGQALFDTGYIGMITIGPSNTLLIADSNNDVLRALNRGSAPVTVAGITIQPDEVRIIAGNGTRGFNGNGLAPLATELSRPTHALALPDGSIVIADYGNSRIRKIRADGSAIVPITDGGYGYGGDGGPALSAQCAGPVATALDGSRLFVQEYSDRVRVIDLDTSQGVSFGGVSIGAGSIDIVASNGSTVAADDGGPALSHRWYTTFTPPLVDAAGNLLVMDPANDLLRRVDAITGADDVIAGLAGESTLDRFLDEPTAMAVTSTGGILVSSRNARMWIVDPKTGARTLFAGTGSPDLSGDGGPAVSAGIWADGIAVGPDGSVYASEGPHLVIRKIDPAGIVTTVAGTGSYQSPPTGDGGPALSATFQGPRGLAIDSAGNLFVIDDESVRFVNLGTSDVTIGSVTIAPGHIDRVAGSYSCCFTADPGPALSARFDLKGFVNGLAVSGDWIYLADFYNARIRRVSRSSGVVETFAGTGDDHWRGDGGPAAVASVGQPLSLFVHGGFLYWAQQVNGVVRRTDLGGARVEPIAGKDSGFWGVGGRAVDAQIQARAVAVGADGTVYVGDGSGRVMKVAP